MNRQYFFKHFGSSMIFAIFGTLIAAFLTGGVLFYTGEQKITTVVLQLIPTHDCFSFEKNRATILLK